MLIDSHAHLDFPDFDNDLDGVILSAKNAGVEKIINVGADLSRSKKAISVAEKYNNVWATVGIHPEDSENIDIPRAIDEMRALIAGSKRVVAVGECGLDYNYSENRKKEQKALFQAQVELAKELNLPLVLHVRNGSDESAARDAYDILQTSGHKRGVVHCFTLGAEWAEKFINLGCHIGFTGIITYKNAENVRSSVKNVPMKKLLVETDAPYLAPQSVRGQRNEPAYVIEVAEKIAEIKHIDIKEVAETTTSNCQRLFNI